MQDRNYHITREGRDGLGLSSRPGTDRYNQINDGLSGRTGITEDCELCSGNINLEGAEKERVINELDEMIRDKVGDDCMEAGEKEYQEEKEKEAKERNEAIVDREKLDQDRIVATDETIEPSGTVFAEDNKNNTERITDPGHLLTDEEEVTNETGDCGCGMADDMEMSDITADDLADGAVITEVTDLIDEEGNRTIIVESVEIEPVDETEETPDDIESKDKTNK